MDRAWAEVRRLMGVNARHRAGWRLGEASPELSLKNAAQELIELAGAEAAGNDRLGELADVFGCLIVYAVKGGWPAECVEEALLAKLAARFSG